MRTATVVNQRPNLHAETQAADFRALPSSLEPPPRNHVSRHYDGMIVESFKLLDQGVK
jgi:hypothetical protein